MELIADFCEFESGPDGGFLSQGTLSLRGVRVDLLVKIDEFGMSSAESVQVSGQSPVVEFSGGVLDKGVGGGIGGEKIDKPVRKGLHGSVGVVWGGVDIENGGSARSNVSIAEGGHAIIVELFDPFGRTLLTVREADFQGWIMSIVLDVSIGWGGKGFFILKNLRLERIQGFVK